MMRNSSYSKIQVAQPQYNVEHLPIQRSSQKNIIPPPQVQRFIIPPQQIIHKNTF